MPDSAVVSICRVFFIRTLLLTLYPQHFICTAISTVKETCTEDESLIELPREPEEPKNCYLAGLSWVCVIVYVMDGCS